MKNERNTGEERDDFSKIEVFYKYMDVKLKLDQKSILMEELQATIDQLRELLYLAQSKTYAASRKKNVDAKIQQLRFFEEDYRVYSTRQSNT
ncbi:hypothetical protein ABB02_01985 [Clostridiaceae bacterium JG1575]|nr:hypothetical protein ABB02_01985 [Clostridiaceae bacterium JG1575]